MYSVLNPEAPEFYPNLTSVAKDGYTALSKSINNSRKMPSGISLQHFMTYAGFNAVTQQIGNNIVQQSNVIFTSEMPTKSLKCFDNESNTEKIVDANDALLDRVNTHVDILAGTRPHESVNSLGPWHKTPLSEPHMPKIQLLSKTLIGGKNIPRPQLTFKDTIDNSAKIWVPKITSKPNNIKPLALTMIYDDQGEPIGFEHPYSVELDLYNPPAEFLTMPEEPELPASLDDTPLSFVNTEAQVDELIQHLYTVNELAVDLEHHSYRTYQGITCLMQITTDTGGDFLVDTLAVRQHIHKFNEIFTDPKKLKVFHGAESDILWLQRDFGVYVVGMFDTHQASRILRLPGFSLKHILLNYCNYNTDKKFQLADWRIRPLPEELATYARSDTHYLLYVARRMRRELLACHGGRPTLLNSVFEQSKRICAKTYKLEILDDKSHLPLYERSRKSFNSRQMTAFKMMFKWRDEHARELDESPSYLIPNYMLLSLAEILPRDIQGVDACCVPMPPFVKQNVITLHRMILTCRELPLEPQLFQMPASLSSMVNIQPALSYNVHDNANLPDHSEEFDINLDYCLELALEPTKFHSDIPIVESEPIKDFVTDLNVDAKMFIPPYDRYRKYRCLAQVEELKEFREKEAKIAALTKGNELLTAEVKKVQAKTQVNTELTEKKEEVKEETKVVDERHQRKRKMPVEIPERKSVNNTTSPQCSAQLKSSIYKNSNYKKFYDDSRELRKQNKQKFKKQK